MFDNVGKNNDQEALRRNFASLVLTITLASVGSATIVLYGMLKVAQAVVAPQQEEEMVAVEQVDPTIEEAPPPPPPPPAAAAPTVHEDTETKVTPDEPQDDVKKLDETVDTTVKNDVVAAAPEGGVVGGEVGGVVGGVVGGEQGGVVGGQIGGIRTFHWTELEVKRRVLPEYPDAAKSMNLGDVDCRVRVFIDEEGVPFDVKFEACPKVFEGSAQDAVMKWRWYPAKVGGEKVKAQFVITIKYKLT